MRGVVSTPSPAKLVPSPYKQGESAVRTVFTYIKILTQFFLQEARRVTHTLCHDFLGRATGNDGSALVTAFGAEVYDVVGTLNYIEIVLNDKHGVPAGNECFERAEQALDIVEVEPRSGFVENE